MKAAKEAVPSASEVIKACDKDGDKQVSLKEAKQCAKKIGITGKALKEGMKVLKQVAGKNGKISLKEL